MPDNDRRENGGITMGHVIGIILYFIYAVFANAFKRR